MADKHMQSPRVVVVGTTSDYIELIRRRYPHRALFLTNPAERAMASEETPGPAEEILCDFTDDGQVLNILKDHLRRYGLAVDGVACFDCEYLGFAAYLPLLWRRAATSFFLSRRGKESKLPVQKLPSFVTVQSSASFLTR